jgi:hypothetical protein
MRAGGARRFNQRAHPADALAMSTSDYSRRIEVRAPSRDFSAGVQTALARLGYELVSARGRAEAPDARILAAGRLSRLRADATSPIVLIGGPRSWGGDDPRVIGVVRRPVGLVDLYRALQEALEVHPRAVPRVPVLLAARSLREGTGTPGAILSLSERGCYLRSVSSPPGDGTLRLQFRLPRERLIETRAQPRNRAGNETGLAFEGLPEASRAAIAGFVTRSLTRDL